MTANPQVTVKVEHNSAAAVQQHAHLDQIVQKYRAKAKKAGAA